MTKMLTIVTNSALEKTAEKTDNRLGRFMDAKRLRHRKPVHTARRKKTQTERRTRSILKFREDTGVAAISTSSLEKNRKKYLGTAPSFAALSMLRCGKRQCHCLFDGSNDAMDRNNHY